MEAQDQVISEVDEQPAVVISLERIGANRVVARRLTDITPELVARARVTMAKYREALMNLT